MKKSTIALTILAVFAGNHAATAATVSTIDWVMGGYDLHWGETVQDTVNNNATVTSENATNIDSLGQQVKSNEQWLQGVNDIQQRDHIADIGRDDKIAANAKAVNDEAAVRQAQVVHLSNTVDTETTERKAADSATDTRVSQNSDAIADNTRQIDTSAKQISTNTTNIDSLGQQVKSNEQWLQGVNDIQQRDHIADIGRDDKIAANAKAVNDEAAVRQAQVVHLSNTVDTETTERKAADSATDTRVSQNSDAIADNTDLIQTSAKQISDNKDAIGINKSAISTNATGILNAENDALTAAKSATIAQNSAVKAQDSANVAEKDATGAKDAANQAMSYTRGFSARITQDESVAEYAETRADTAFANAAANKQALASTNRRVADNSAELANHETRIGALESQTTSNFAKLKNQVDDNRKRSSAGIAGVAAMANIPQVTNTQNFSVGAGVGTADSESALAVGFSARATENTVVKASVSNDTQHNFVAGAGVSYGW